MKTLPSYIACGTELVPPARAPHIVYVKTPYRIAGQGYCRHHSARRPQVYHELVLMATNASSASGVTTTTSKSSLNMSWQRPARTSMQVRAPGDYRAG